MRGPAASPRASTSASYCSQGTSRSTTTWSRRLDRATGREPEPGLSSRVGCARAWASAWSTSRAYHTSPRLASRACDGYGARVSPRDPEAQGPAAAAREPDFIEVEGAREHNLDIARLDVPKRKFVVFTGVSGSGKSSLAFDTLYAEGQRRYVETLSSYARQFLGQLERPHVEHLRGLSPTIAIEQKSASNNPRSTVGIITEIYDYLRVLYARAGVQHCHVCGERVSAQSADQVVDEILALPQGSKITLVAPLVAHRKGEFREVFDEL